MNKLGKLFLRFIAAPIVCIVAYYFVISFSLELTYVLYQDSYKDHDSITYLMVGIFGLLFCGIWVFLCRKFHGPKLHIGKGKQEDWAMPLLGALCILGICSLYFIIIGHFHSPMIEKSMKEYNAMMAIKQKNTFELVASLLSSCLLIPILEEILFRGIALEGMLSEAPAFFGIFVSGVWFGIMHAQLVQIGYAILAGMILGLIYYATDNLLISILTHVIFNFLGSGLYEITSLPNEVTYILHALEYAAIIVFAVVVSFLLYNKRRKSKTEENPSEEEVHAENSL